MSAIRMTGAALLAAAIMSACTMENTPTSASSTIPEHPVIAALNGTGHNASDHFSGTTAVTFDIENPCNGEVITFSGHEFDQMTFVDTREHLDDGFSLHTEFQAALSLTGTGPVTGASYAINDVFHENFESPSPPAPDFTASSHETLHAISQPPEQGFFIHNLFHIVGLPTGGVLVTRDVESITCGR